MYKKLFAIGSLLALTLTCAAQEVTQGSIRSLQGCRVATVLFDFTNAQVDGAPLSDVVDTQIYENGASYTSEFEKDKRDIISDFIEEFNDTNCPILLTVASSPQILMNVKVQQISRKGNCVSCDYVFVAKEDPDNPLLIVSMTAKDGRFGSFTNLMGDAFERAGKNLGKYLKKQLKKTENKFD